MVRASRSSMIIRTPTEGKILVLSRPLCLSDLVFEFQQFSLPPSAIAGISLRRDQFVGGLENGFEPDI
jgi:hypothetical protein